MTPDQQTLWRNLQELELDDPESSFCFSERLARDNRWTLSYSLRAIEEYKKFIFLICIAHHPLTPSDQVDQVWHLHLLYTQSYWTDMCKNLLNREIHHGPTKGGTKEKTKFQDWYEKTKNLYSMTFNENPPADVWQDSKTRFSDIDFARVNLKKNWIIKKPNLFS